MTIRVALPLIGRGSWTGGYVYLKNTLRLIRLRLAEKIEPYVFLSPAEYEKYGEELAALVDGRLIVDPDIAVSGRGMSLARGLIIGRDKSLARLLLAEDIEVTFEVASFYGARFPIPIISWMPDFQHRKMPEMFGRLNWWRRDLGYRMQILSSRTLMLSSAAARDDLERYYPAARGRGHVVRFAIDLDIASFLERGEEMRTIYNLPPHFFFLPNQFWQHKNHSLIVEALTRLKTDGQLNGVPPVILSGLNKDPRNPAHFDALMQKAREAGVDGHFRYLGLIPYEHVLSLSATCKALINPSLFEGWSTPIEEAKAFATPLMLSDIPIHREQAPNARFFNARSAKTAADALLNVAHRATALRPSTAELVTIQNQRLDAHAASLLKTVRAAAGQIKMAVA